jgi:hypothetical protein
VTRWRPALGAVLLCLLAPASGAFVLSGHRWPQPSATVYYGLLSEPYASAFAGAAGDWTSRTIFQYTAQTSQIGPCSASGPLGLGNGVNFAATDCGDSGFGNDTLAITQTVYDSDTGFLLAAAITFNSAEPWAVYDGPAQAVNIDFRRVALHELGHFLGLGHETTLPAIMNPAVTDIDRLQDDDVNGVQALYVPLVSAVLLAPTGIVTTTRPTYQWNAAGGASWYQFYLQEPSGRTTDTWNHASDLGCGAGNGVCSLDPGVNLQNGIHSFWVESWNNVRAGPWSARGDFAVAVSVVGPGAATLLMPTGTVTSRPTFQWTAQASSTWYQLWLRSPAGTTTQTWYRAADAGCASGTGNCQVTPSENLENGSWAFAVQTWGPAGGGSWSAPQPFTLDSPLLAPPATTLVEPFAQTATPSPTFQWNALDTSTWYQLYVSKGSSTFAQKWYRASAVGCGSGTGVCSIQLSSPLGGGAYRFWVQTWNSNGPGPWSAPSDFTIP